MFKPYIITTFRVGGMSGFRIEVSKEYGHVPELPIKKGILTGKNRDFPTEDQAKRALKRFEKAYFER